MKRNPRARGTRRATTCPWPPPSFALRDAEPDPLRQGGTLRAHAAQATLEALLRQRLPAGLRPRGDVADAIAPPLLLSGWRVEGAPPRAANGGDDLMGAAQDGAPSTATAQATRIASEAAVAGPQADAPWPHWQGRASMEDALFRIF
jgi:hypothetical protein